MTRHFIIRIEDGKNFLNSKHPMWGVKKGVKSTVSNMRPGDILWFVTNSSGGNKVLGMAEFVSMYDRRDEPLFSIHTYTNEEMGWSGNTDWCIQIHYKNLYYTKRQNIYVKIPGQWPVCYYEKNRAYIHDDLYEHYAGFKKYAVPIYTDQ